MKKSFLALASLAAIAVACQVEKMDELPLVDNSVVYTASTEAYAPATKTAMDELNVVWSEGDEIAVFQGYTMQDKFVVSNTTVGTTLGEFTLVSEGSKDWADELTGNVAFYPYMSDDGWPDFLVYSDQGDNLVHLMTNLPSTQNYEEGTFANGAFPMIAVSETDEFAFKNVLGLLKLSLTGTKTVKSLKVSGNNSEPLAGQCMITMENQVPSCMIDTYSALTSVTLDCGDGVELDATTATDFYIALPETTFENGFTVALTDENNDVYKFNTTKSNTVKRSKILVMPEYDVDDLTLDIKFSATPGLTDADVKIELDIDGATGFYGIYALKDNWDLYGSYASQMFDDLISGIGTFAQMGIPCNEYVGTTFEGNLSEFGWSEEMIDDYGMYNEITPNTIYNVIIIPIIDGKEDYSIQDASVYEVKTSSLTISEEVVALPPYVINQDYEKVEVVFDSSSENMIYTYGFFSADEENLPTDENCLDPEVLWLTTPKTEDGYFVEHTNDYGVLPGTAYKLCVVVVNPDGEAYLHTLGVATKEIPYDESLAVTYVVPEEGETNPYYEEIDNMVSAEVEVPVDATKLYYAVNKTSYTEYSAATSIADILRGDTDGWNVLENLTDFDGYLDVDVTSLNEYTPVGTNVEVRFHVIAMDADSNVSYICTSDVVEIPGLYVNNN